MSEFGRNPTPATRAFLPSQPMPLPPAPAEDDLPPIDDAPPAEEDDPAGPKA